METIVSHKDCDGLLERTAELVAKFEPQEQKPVFSTTEKKQTSDQHFLESGDKIRFFFEHDAFGADGSLQDEASLAVLTNFANASAAHFSAHAKVAASA